MGKNLAFRCSSAINASVLSYQKDMIGTNTRHATVALGVERVGW